MMVGTSDDGAGHGRVEGFVRGEIGRLWGPAARVRHLEVVHTADTSTVVLVTLDDPSGKIVFKIAGLGSNVGTDFERTAAVVGLAHAAGVPVASVLAVDTSGRAGPWQYLVQKHIPGMPWRRVRPLLDEEGLDAAYREIAEAVLAIQTVRFDGFGELDGSARSTGLTLLAGLHRRAERILHNRDRTAFVRLLHQHEHLVVDEPGPATLCHDDLHHDNVLFAQRAGTWHIAGILDWDKAWAGPVESDIARMSFWDDMTGRGFWQVYRAAVPASPATEERFPIHQLLWCLEYDNVSNRHTADTASLWHRLGAKQPNRSS
jgi:hypothetical protein